MKKISPILLIVGLLMVAAGVMMPIITENIFNDTFRWVYAAGAAVALIARIFQPQVPAGTPLRIKRLARLETWSTLLFCVGAFFAFYSAPILRDWLAFTLAGAALQVYSAIALSILQRKKQA